MADPHAKDNQIPARGEQIVHNVRGGATVTSAIHAVGKPAAELGFTVDEALEIRTDLRSWQELWDDPDLDLYNDLFEG